MSIEEISDALTSMKEDKLSETMVQQFLTFIPTAEEVEALSEQKDQRKHMDTAEQFFLESISIKHYEQRLRCIFAKKKFAEQIRDIEPVCRGILSGMWFWLRLTCLHSKLIR